MKDTLQPLVDQFMPFARKRMGFNKMPRVFLRDDPQNAQNPLGKTAYYDPAKMSVTLYINGRHPKDVMRSLSHELVHHTQNCNGQFDNVGELGEGYAQNDEHLREMEREAYEQGNLVFRDWEDSIKETIYNESLQKGAKNKMSFKDWKNSELSTLLTEKWGFSFNLLTESQEEEVVEEAAEEDTLNEEEEDELEERRARGRDREGMEPDSRRRPMEEAEKPDFPDVDGDGDREEPISKASKEKQGDKGDDKEEKSDKDVSKVPPQLRKHVKGKMDERNYLDTMDGADMKLSDKQKEQLGYLLAKRGEKLSLDPVKRKRQINYYIKMLDNRAKEKLDQTPAYMDKDDNKPAVRMMDEQKIRRIIRKLVKEAAAKKAR